MADKWYPCGHCGAVFTNIDEARAHKKTCDGDTGGNNGGSGNTPDDEFVCGKCSQIFSSQTALGAHALKCYKYD